jgi:hypothetical protein
MFLFALIASIQKVSYMHIKLVTHNKRVNTDRKNRVREQLFLILEAMNISVNCSLTPFICEISFNQPLTLKMYNETRGLVN